MKRFRAALEISAVLLILYSCGREVFTGPEPEAERITGKVFIRSSPAGALIYLNYMNTGTKTPDTLRWIDQGSHRVTLKMPLYQDTTVFVNVTGSGVQNVYINFAQNSKNQGNIYCNSDPAGADIWLNESGTGQKTPYTINHLAPGNYKVKLTSAVHRPDSTSVTVSSSSTASVYLVLEDTSKWVSYTSHNSPMTSDHITSIVGDNNNIVWFGTDNGLMSLSGNKWRSYTTENSIMRSSYITSICVDDKNRKWIGTSIGLYVIEGETWTDYSGNLPESHITSIVKDKTGNIWVGTYGGAVRYSGNSWTIFNTANSGLKDNTVTCMTADNLNRIWIGSVHNYISIYDGSSWKYFDETNIHKDITGTGAAAPSIQALATDNTGKVWVSFYYTDRPVNYLKVFDGSAFVNSTYQVSYINTMWAKDSHLVFGTTSWLSVLENNSGTFKNFMTANSAIKLYQIQTVTMDSQNNIWLGTLFDGAAKFKKGNFP